MPKKANTKKAASAQYQNIKALAEAASGAEGLVYLAVEKPMGNSRFLCINSEGHQIEAVPRSLFTRGSMRIEAGSIVVAEAPTMPAWKAEVMAQKRTEHLVASRKAKQSGGAEPPRPSCLAHEIVGVITELSEAKRLVRARIMPQSILDMASGQTQTAQHVQEYEFMTPQEEARQTRQEKLAAMEPEERAEFLAKEKRDQMAGGFSASGLDLEEVSEHRGKDEGHHASRGMKQARMAAEARSSIQQRLAALLSGSKKAAADIKLGSALEDEDAPLAGGGPQRLKQFRPKKTEEEKEAQREAAAAAAEQARKAAELDDIITGLMGTSAAAEVEPDVATQVAALRAELEAMGEVESWEEAADAEISLEDL